MHSPGMSKSGEETSQILKKTQKKFCEHFCVLFVWLFLYVSSWFLLGCNWAWVRGVCRWQRQKGSFLLISFGFSPVTPNGIIHLLCHRRPSYNNSVETEPPLKTWCPIHPLRPKSPALHLWWPWLRASSFLRRSSWCRGARWLAGARGWTWGWVGVRRPPFDWWRPGASGNFYRFLKVHGFWLMGSLRKSGILSR